MIESITDSVITSLRKHDQVPLFSTSPQGLEVADAYLVTAQLRATFEAGGERITGGKIGFTNRDMWDVYGVRAPIWGCCTNKTNFDLDATSVQRVSDFVEPRIRAGDNFRPRRSAGCIDE